MFTERLRCPRHMYSLLLLGPYPPPAGGVASYLASVFRNLPSGECAWYGHGDSPYQGPGVEVVRGNDFDPARCLWTRFRAPVALDSSTVFLEYLDWRLLIRWLPSIVLHRVRWVKVVHDGNLPSRFQSYPGSTKWLTRIASWFVWRYIAVNEELARWLQVNIAPSHKIAVIPSLIEAPALSQESVEDPGFLGARARYKRLVCAVGALNPEYGFQDVAQAIRRLTIRRGEELGLVLLSTGFAREPDFLEGLFGACPNLVLLENLPREQALAVMRDCDVVVRATRRESYGLSRVEAICQGTPVVATNVGQVRGLYTYEFGDVEKLASLLDLALTSGGAEATAMTAEDYRAEGERNRRELMLLLESAVA